MDGAAEQHMSEQRLAEACRTDEAKAGCGRWCDTSGCSARTSVCPRHGTHLYFIVQPRRLACYDVGLWWCPGPGGLVDLI